jgi:hypothetical protein
MNVRQHSTPRGRQFKPKNVTRNEDLVELWADLLAASAPTPPLQTCLYRPPFTAASTDEYAPAYYTPAPSI